MKLFVILAVAALLAGGVAFAFARTPQPIDRTTVRTLDPNRYMGRWYEIARYDHSFERNLAQVQALYTLQPDSRITVENSGVDTRSGRRGVAHGKARTTADPGRLRVSSSGSSIPITTSSSSTPTTAGRWWAAARRNTSGSSPAPRLLRPRPSTKSSAGPGPAVTTPRG